MAPGKAQSKINDIFVKETLLFKYCQKGIVPKNYTSLHSLERNFGLKYSVSNLSKFLKYLTNGLLIRI